MINLFLIEDLFGFKKYFNKWAPNALEQIIIKRKFLFEENNFFWECWRQDYEHILMPTNHHQMKGLSEKSSDFVFYEYFLRRIVVMK